MPREEVRSGRYRDEASVGRGEDLVPRGAWRHTVHQMDDVPGLEELRDRKAEGEIRVGAVIDRQEVRRRRVLFLFVCLFVQGW